ncbi:unnamed protein product [Periconia digitata]|uniref:Serine hydrolase domain-containing protein n=1 Tax=Periconia digitata TaxID=1303443 RepID=A0A9W4U224_9PLEO|nr:unnamed protein product [Periconia digitata]
MHKMHFLCLHGKGTNNKVFEAQTAALRYAINSDQHHTYDFAEGALETTMEESIRDLFPATSSYYSYFDLSTPSSMVKVLRDLERFIVAEGPFDGVLAFSQGAAVAATLMAQRMKRDAAQERLRPVFKCAVFVGAAAPCDPIELEEHGRVRVLDAAVDGEVIEVPTAHIWGEQDASLYPQLLAGLCRAEGRNVYVHEGGHAIPGSQTDEALAGSVRVVKRCIAMAQYGQVPR